MRRNVAEYALGSPADQARFAGQILCDAVLPISRSNQDSDQATCPLLSAPADHQTTEEVVACKCRRADVRVPYHYWLASFSWLLRDVEALQNKSAHMPTVVHESASQTLGCSQTPAIFHTAYKTTLRLQHAIPSTLLPLGPQTTKVRAPAHYHPVHPKWWKPDCRRA